MSEMEALQSVLQVHAFSPVSQQAEHQLIQQQQQQVFNLTHQAGASQAGGPGHAAVTGIYNPVNFNHQQHLPPPQEQPLQHLNPQYFGMSYDMHPNAGHGVGAPSQPQAHQAPSVQVKPEPVDPQPYAPPVPVASERPPFQPAAPTVHVKSELVEHQPPNWELMEDVKPQIPQASLTSNGSAFTGAEEIEEKHLVEVKPGEDVDIYNRDSRTSTPVTADSSRNGSPSTSLPPPVPETVPGPSRRRLVQTTLKPCRKRGIVAVASETEVNKFIASGRTDSSTIAKNAVQKTSSGSEESRAMMREIYKLLQPGVLQQNKPGHLFKHLRLREDKEGNPLPPTFEPTPQQLATIMSELFQHASASYLAAMGDNDRYAEMYRIWIRNSVREPELWEPSLAPILNVLSRTDMPVNYLQEDFKIARLAKKAVDKATEVNLFSAPQIRKAYTRFDKYYNEVLLPKNRRRPLDESDSDSDAPTVTKKRKVETKPDSKAAPAKPTSTSHAKANAGASGAAGKVPGRADMSFFGANSGAATATAKPKPKLPNFTKRAADAPAAPTSSLLASTMRMLKKEDPSPKVPAPPRSGGLSPAVSQPRQPVKPAVKLNKKGFAVRWVDETPNAGRPLEAIRTFRQEAHELIREPWQEIDESVQGMSAHDLDRQEGKLLHHAAEAFDPIEEAMDWYDPCAYSRGGEQDEPIGPTPESEEQEKREKAIQPVIYLNSDIPPTPVEDGVRVISADTDTRKMEGVRAAPPPNLGPAAAPAPTDLSNLLKNLTGALPAAAAPPAAPAAPAAYNGYDYNAQYYQNPPGSTYQQQQQQQPGGWAGQQHQQQQGWNRQAEAPGYTGNRWARPPGGPKKICRFHRTREGCRLGSRCNFLHA